MGSYSEGKDFIVNWIQQNFLKGSTCLDVGACDGKWRDLIGDYMVMDACEIWMPNIEYHKLKSKYRMVFNCDIDKLAYQWYDLIIFGDVIEHMPVETAQSVLNFARTHCKDMIIGVPFLYRQDAIYGNPYERHIQDDLTEELFAERYEGFEKILQPRSDYAYYHKK